MAFSFNRTKADLGSYPPFLLMGPRGFGKSTFYKKLINHLYHDQSCGLLISCGTEKGHKSLNGIQYAYAQVWDKEYEEDKITGEGRGFIDIIDEVVNEYGNHNIKVVFIDTLDTLTEICEPEILRLHRKEYKDKAPAKSYNQAMGGFQEGHRRAAKLIRQQVDRLNELGIAVFYLAHTKFKNKKETFTKEEYETYTNSLLPVFYDGVADTCQMVMVGTIEKTITDKHVEEERRVLYLRPTFLIEAKSRFTHLPEKIEFTLDDCAKNFMDAFNEAVRFELEEDGFDVDLEEVRKEEVKARNEVSKETKEKDVKIRQKENAVDEIRNLELISIIQSKYSSTSADVRTKIRQIMENNNFTKFSDENIPTAALEEIVGLL